MLAPRPKVIVIEMIDPPKKILNIGHGKVQLVKIIKKGADCADFYKEGDTCMILDGQQLECTEVGCIVCWDDDILGVWNG